MYIENIMSMESAAEICFLSLNEMIPLLFDGVDWLKNCQYYIWAVVIEKLSI